MKNEVEYWETFWEDKNVPLHADNTNEYYDKYAKELSLILGNKSYNSVLELGCGSGTFYDRLGFSKAKYYKGTDLSSSMLEEFKKDFPNASLEKASGHDYVDDNKYDLIFSNGVMQNFNEDMLRGHFKLATKMLNKGGIIVDASLPWSTHRYNYRVGLLNPPYQATFKGRASWLATTIKIRKDSMGHWYSPNDFSRIASEFGLIGEFIGSIQYPYRFHSILKKMS